MRKETLIARTDPDSAGRYRELYLTGYRDGPAFGFVYQYDPSPNTKKNRIKKRTNLPLHTMISNDAEWRPAVNENLMPSLWDPNDDSPKSEYVDRLVEMWLENVRR